jgi:protein-arginine kinase activator protein McsA
VPLSRLQQQLDAAVEGEDYAAAAQLRDEIE